MKILESQLLPASSFKNITGKDPFSISKAKSLYDHAYNTSRQIFGIKDSLHDLGYERKHILKCLIYLMEWLEELLL